MGPIKSVTFSKNDVPFLKESRMEAATKDGGSPAILARELYNAEVSMYGNNFWTPGMMVYMNLVNFNVNPGEDNTRFSGLSAPSFFGLEGYYRVTKTSHSFESGKFESKITLMYEFSKHEELNPVKFDRNDINFLCREIRGRIGNLESGNMETNEDN